MTGKFLPKGGGIYEVSFGFHSKRGGYTTLMSDMPKLGDIAANIIRFKYQ
ncbi:MAG: hypothetical protein WBE22_09355 [Halobacteriota archaeon]